MKAPTRAAIGRIPYLTVSLAGAQMDRFVNICLMHASFISMVLHFC